MMSNTNDEKRQAEPGSQDLEDRGPRSSSAGKPLFRAEAPLEILGRFVWKNRVWWMIPILLVFLWLFVLVLTDPGFHPIIYILPSN